MLILYTVAGSCMQLQTETKGLRWCLPSSAAYSYWSSKPQVNRSNGTNCLKPDTAGMPLDAGAAQGSTSPEAAGGGYSPKH